MCGPFIDDLNCLLQSSSTFTTYIKFSLTVSPAHSPTSCTNVAHIIAYQWRAPLIKTNALPFSTVTNSIKKRIQYFRYILLSPWLLPLIPQVRSPISAPKTKTQTPFLSSSLSLPSAGNPSPPASLPGLHVAVRPGPAGNSDPNRRSGRCPSAFRWRKCRRSRSFWGRSNSRLAR